jgi:hypothetical protein
VAVRRLEWWSDGVIAKPLQRKNKNRGADQMSDEQFEQLDSLAFRLENGLLKLIESLERKRNKNEWIDTLIEDPREKRDPTHRL